MTRTRVRHHVNPLADRTEHVFDGFENDKPIIVDIGSDRGEFVTRLLEKFGETRNFIMCEIRKPLAEKLKKKYVDQKNVVVFDGDAGRNFENLLRPSIEKGFLIEEIYVNFPDPWFKERHKKRRFINEKFLKEAMKIISPKTRWYFQTDQKNLFDETCDLLCNNNIHVTRFLEPPHNCTTKWEDAKISQGNEIYRIYFYMNYAA
jgi:tRNA (guanine-N7-)-methyltransferase